MTKTTEDIEKFQYNHVFNLILSIFKFNEKKYGNFVKDTIKILLEFEKNGETIIAIFKQIIPDRTVIYWRQLIFISN